MRKGKWIIDLPNLEQLTYDYQYIVQPLANPYKA